MAEKLDLDALERIADEERWRGNRTDGNHFNVRMDYHNATRPSTIYALIARIRALESASQPGSGEAVETLMMLMRANPNAYVSDILPHAEDYLARAAPSAGNGEAKGGLGGVKA